jgi:ribonuclease Z
MTTDEGLRVTLLGTGTPIPRPDRFGPSTLIEAGGQKILIDAGRGATMRLYQLGVPMGRVNALLLTHFHSDHTTGIPDFWLTGWLSSFYARRTAPLHVFGPTGAKELISNLEKAYAADIKIRLVDEKLPPEGIATRVEEFDHDGLIYDQAGLKVFAFEVDHGEVIKPCFGYRIEYGGRIAAFSGDTRYNRNVIKYGAGADLLVHEVATARPELMKEAYIQRIVAHHTTPREAGLVFAEARPKLAVYTHIVQLASDTISPPSVEESIAETRKTYDGPLEVGEDLMQFEIGEDVKVRRYDGHNAAMMP